MNVDLASGVEKDGQQVWCPDCNLWMNGPVHVANHNDGFKHRKNTRTKVVMQQRCRKIEDEERAVCRGMPFVVEIIEEGSDPKRQIVDEVKYLVARRREAADQTLQKRLRELELHCSRFSLRGDSHRSSTTSTPLVLAETLLAETPQPLRSSRELDHIVRR